MVLWGGKIQSSCQKKIRFLTQKHKHKAQSCGGRNDNALLPEFSILSRCRSPSPPQSASARWVHRLAHIHSGSSRTDLLIGCWLAAVAAIFLLLLWTLYVTLIGASQGRCVKLCFFSQTLPFSPIRSISTDGSSRDRNRKLLLALLLVNSATSCVFMTPRIELKLNIAIKKTGHGNT